MVGIGGLIGMMLSLVILLNYDLMLYIILGVIASGLVGASRLYLKEHTPSQVYLGFLLGVFCQFILFLPLQQINLNF
jgi:membrane-associated phospholipid phosphatase